jgi:hypothetical protein
MTDTLVKKGAGRPAASARQSKAAQRTALPGDAPVTTEPEQLGAVAAERLQSMSVPQLRSLARQSGLSSITRLTKRAELVAALAKVAQNAAAKRTATPTRKPAAAKSQPKTQRTTGKAPTGGSRSKAEALAATLAPFGWTVELKDGKADQVDLTATRGTETLRQSWRAGVWLYELSRFTIADRTVKPRNASSARQLCAREAGQ